MPERDDAGPVPEHVAAYFAGIAMGMEVIARAAAKAAGVSATAALPSNREFHHAAALACRQLGLGGFSDEALIAAAAAWHRGHPVRDVRWRP